MKPSDLLRMGLYRESDDNAIPGAGITPPPVIVDLAAGADPAADPTPATPATISLTPEELDERIQRGVIAAVEKIQGRGAAPETPPANPGVYDPAAESYSLFKESVKMNTEALSLYPDLPEEYKAKIEARLEQIPADQIAAIRTNGLHKTLAREVMTDAMEAGKYIPKNFRTTTAPPIEPTGGGAGANSYVEPGLASYNAEVDELEKILGVKLSPEERKAAFAR